MARDNPAALCGACTKAARLRLARPPSVPAAFWLHDDLRDALEAWHMGRLIRAYRLHPWHGEPIQQATVAGWLGIQQAKLSRIENGPAVTDLAQLTGWVTTLNVPAELLWFKLPGSLDVNSSPGGLRHLVDTAADASLAFADETASLPADEVELGHLRRELSRIAVDYVHTSLGEIFRDLVDLREGIESRLTRLQRPERARQLYFLGALSCVLLAHASQNFGNQRAALAQLRAAWTCGEIVDDDALRAWLSGTAALVSEWSSKHAEAVNLAAEGARFRSSGQSGIRLAAIEARAAARLGDRDSSLKAVARVQRAQELVVDDDGVTEFGGVLSFPRSKQQYYLGSAFGLLGDHPAAERYARSAITAYELGSPAARSYGDEALARLDVVNARISTDDFNGAGEAVGPVLDLPADRRIRQLESAMSRTCGLLRQVRTRAAVELLERITDHHNSAGTALRSSQ